MQDEIFNCIVSSLKRISNQQIVIDRQTKIMEDLGLESIDFVDFVFELEKAVKIPLDITQMSIVLTKTSGRRFKEVTVADVESYLLSLTK